MSFIQSTADADVNERQSTDAKVCMAVCCARSIFSNIGVVDICALARVLNSEFKKVEKYHDVQLSDWRFPAEFLLWSIAPQN
jgi:hypothetical protein